MRIDGGGHVVWDQTVDSAMHVDGAVAAPNGGVVIQGTVPHRRGHGVDPALLRVDPNGKLLWRRQLGGYVNAQAGATVAVDGGWLLPLKPMSPTNAIVAVKIANDGTVAHSGIYALDGVSTSTAIAVPAATSGAFLIGSLFGPIAVVRVDGAGAQQWSKSYPVPGEPLSLVAQATADDGLFPGGVGRSSVLLGSFETQDSVLGLRIATGGEAYWVQTYGKFGSVSPVSVWAETTADGGFVFGCSTDPPFYTVPFVSSGYVVKTDGYGVTGLYVPLPAP